MTEGDSTDGADDPASTVVNEIPVTVATGESDTGNNFVEEVQASISGTVTVDTNDDGSGDVGLAEVTLQLVEVVDGAEVIVATTETTGTNGAYVFNDVTPGNYIVRQVQPENHLTVSEGDSTEGEDDSASTVTNEIPVAVTAGESDTGNDFVEFEAKDSTYADFLETFAEGLGDETGPADNPDGDIFENALEYAFYLHPDSGITGDGEFCLTKDPATGEVSAEFLRARGGLSDVQYTLEGAETLGTPTSWTTLNVIPTVNTTDEDIPTNAERVTYANIQTASPTTLDSGVVRLRVEVDVDGSGDFSADETFFSQAFGWQCLNYNDYECATFSNPFSEKPVFSGTFAGVIQDPENPNNPVTLTIESAGGELTLDVSDSAFGEDLSTLVGTDGEYYLQITSGVFEGHRFDIVRGGVDSITLLSDDDIFDPTVDSLNTLDGLPDDASLNGVSYRVIRYQTVDDVYNRDFVFAGEEDTSVSDATRLLFYDVRRETPGFDSLRLVPVSGGDETSRWVGVDDLFLLADQGGRRLDPSHGSWVHPKSSGSESAPATVPPVRMFVAGLIADHAQAVVLNEGFNLTASMWPLDQTPAGPNGRDFTVAAGFDGGTAPSNSTELLFWRGDQVVDDQNVFEYSTGYDNFMLGDFGPFRYWLDRSTPFVNLDESLILESHRSVMLKILPGDEKKPHLYPQPNF